ncbi:hypothetical protein Acr_24g0014480 [Actinidia rufa]|uniref:Uncharacterized protein n=1 Tax=Actinidia rufa TaxID=165716 RepID=A0A7J0GWY1_9ERIC|nr:hypothetical protein Acr_24g0014480 [Actinidia rufa]
MIETSLVRDVYSGSGAGLVIPLHTRWIVVICNGVYTVTQSPITGEIRTAIPAGEVQKMATNTNTNTPLFPEIGPDGLPGEAPLIAYTEKNGKPIGPAQVSPASDVLSVPSTIVPAGTENIVNQGDSGNAPGANGRNQLPSAEGEKGGK